MRGPVVLLLVALLAACGDSTGPVPATLLMAGGDGQYGAARAALAEPFRVVLRDAAGAPVAGATVTWTVIAGGGAVAAESATGDDGIARATLTVGPEPAPQIVDAATPSLPGATVRFVANPAGAGLRAVGGDRQRGPIDATLPVPLTVEARDQAGAPRADVEIAWAVTAGEAVLIAPSGRTDATGRATVAVALGAAPGPVRVSATLAGTPPARADFLLTALAPEPVLPLAAGALPVPDASPRDLFVRDGLGFVGGWNAGILIYDLGGGGRGGSPSRPLLLASLKIDDTRVQGGPMAVNAWWFHDPVSGERRYLFVGQGGAQSVPGVSAGDLHVLDISDPASPAEVAWLHLPDAGVQEMWVDEPARTLYLAYKNAGVLAVDVSGTLSGDLAGRVVAQNPLGGPGGTFAWGVTPAGDGSVLAGDLAGGVHRLAAAAAGLGTLGSGPGNSRRSGPLVVLGALALAGTVGSYPPPGTPPLEPAGDQLQIWRLDGPAPLLQDSVVFDRAADVRSLGLDPDGRLLAVATTSGANAGVAFYDVSDPAAPVAVGTAPGITGATGVRLQRQGGRLLAYVAGIGPLGEFAVYDVTALAP